MDADAFDFYTAQSACNLTLKGFKIILQLGIEHKPSLSAPFFLLKRLVAETLVSRLDSKYYQFHFQHKLSWGFRPRAVSFTSDDLCSYQYHE